MSDSNSGELIQSLPGEFIQSLREFLVKEFPNLEALEIFLREKCDVTINATISPGKKYDYSVFEVIRWAEEKGRVGDLIDGLRSRNRSDFCSLVEDRFEYMLKFLNPSLGDIPEGQVNCFAELILESGNIQQAIESVKFVLPDISESEGRYDIQALGKKGNDKYRLYIAFLLLREYPKVDRNNKMSRFSSFIQNFSERISDNSELSQALKALFPDIVPEKKNIPEASSGKLKSLLKPRLQAKQDLPNAYLLIQVKVLSADQFHLDAVLEIKPNNFIPIYLEDSAHETQGQKGIICTYQELEEQAVRLIQQGEEKFGNKHDSETGPLIVEIFLPYQYLTEKVDLWQMELMGQPVPIGSQYYIVLRSLDRMEITNLREKLRNPWNNLQGLLEPTKKISGKRWYRYFLHIESLESGWAELNYQRDQKIGVKVTCGLPQKSEDQTKWVAKMLRTGLPFIIWTRSAELREVESLPEAIDLLLKIENFRDVGIFLNCVQRERDKAFLKSDENGKSEDHLGHHLAFLYDNPNRPFPRSCPLMDC